MGADLKPPRELGFFHAGSISCEEDDHGPCEFHEIGRLGTDETWTAIIRRHGFADEVVGDTDLTEAEVDEVLAVAWDQHDRDVTEHGYSVLEPGPGDGDAPSTAGPTGVDFRAQFAAEEVQESLRAADLSDEDRATAEGMLQAFLDFVDAHRRR